MGFFSSSGIGLGLRIGLRINDRSQIPMLRAASLAFPASTASPAVGASRRRCRLISLRSGGTYEVPPTDPRRTLMAPAADAPLHRPFTDLDDPSNTGLSAIFSCGPRVCRSASASSPDRRRSSSPSASNTMISSMRLMNSGLNVRFTSPSTISVTLLAISPVSDDWNPIELFFWMKRAPMLEVMMMIVFLKFTRLPRPSVRWPSSNTCSRMLKISVGLPSHRAGQPIRIGLIFLGVTPSCDQRSGRGPSVEDRLSSIGHVDRIRRESLPKRKGQRARSSV